MASSEARKRPVDRRTALRAAGGGAALAGALVLPTLTASHAAAQEVADIVGSWVVQIEDDSGDTDAGLVTAAPGGVFLFTGAPLSPDPGPTSQFQQSSAGHGVWVSLGGSSYAISFAQLAYDQGGTFVGTAKVSATVVLDDREEGFTGVYRGRFFDPDGGAPLATFSGTVRGERVQLEPLGGGPTSP